MKRSPDRRSERGAVVVMVAVWLPVLALFVSFAIDFAHFWDYSRNLQNRADAAALAAGDAYGSTCFGTPTSTQLASIGHSAQQYAGPPNGTPSPGGTPNGTNLPYIFSSSTPYQNQPNLTSGTGPNFFMVLNGATSADKGGTSFTDGDFCSADYTNPAGPAVDVWLTQEHLPLFFPLVGFQPNISAHARVQLQGEASSPFVRPIAVSDPGAFGCATVKFYKSTDPSTPIATRDLTETNATNFIFDNAANPVSVPIPTDDNGTGNAKAYVYMQVFLSDCSGNGQTFDDTTNSGIEVINSYGTTAPSSGQAPRITSGGVTLCQAGQGSANCAAAPTCDQYFSVVPGGTCSVNVTAHVTFSPDVTNPNSQASVTATDTSTNVTRSLSPDNTGTVWTPSQSFPIGDTTGQHLFRFDWSQKTGTVGGTTCTNQVPCTGTFGIQQQGFGACNGCDQPDDSGPIVKSQIRLDTDLPGTTGQNAFQAGSAPNLVVTLQLAGIRAQANGAPAPDTILRFSGSTNHQTGLVDCGQGNAGGGAGTPADAYTIYGGCGPANPFEPPNCSNANLNCTLPLLNPLYVYGRPPATPTDCSPAVDQNYTDWPSPGAGNHQDCVQTTPGTRRNGIVCALVERVTGVSPAAFQANSSACNGGTCPFNHWTDPNGIPPGDPREIDVVLTSPVDLAAAAGQANYPWVPIRRFAKFYVTGWDPSVGPNCNGTNDPWPGPAGGKQTQNGAIWGHWMSDTENGVGDGTPCQTSSIEPVNCVPVLSR